MAEPAPIEVLREFLKLRAAIADLEAQLEKLKPKVNDFVSGQNGSYEHEGFKFKLVTKPKYSFSDEVEKLSKAVSERKAFEIAEGIAEADGETSYVTVTEAKAKAAKASKK